MKIRWTLIAVLLLIAVVLSGCTAADDVNDPLANYGVDAVVPFPTKKPGNSTATPAPSPSPAPTDVVVSVTQGWQTELLPTPSQAASGSDYKQLARGNSGDAVRKLQSRLKELGYLTGSVDGSYGSQTETAVKRFQKAIGLTQTGVASTYLQERLFASNAPAYQASAVSATATPRPTSTPYVSSATANPYQELSYGSRGTNVLMLQNRLRALGYLNGSADGVFGSQTRQAIMKFEEAYGKPQTGIATEALLKVLYSDNARTYKEAFASATPAPTPYVSGNAGKYTLLSYGSKGEDVKRLQSRLVELGYLQSTVTGNYYNKTVEAVSKFQKAVGLSETGVATAAMQEILFSANAPRYSASGAVKPKPTASAGYTQLSYGSIGQPVAEMQARLIELGFLSGSADGYYYAQTVEAVKAFQAALGWSQTGVATSDMLAILFSSAAPDNGNNTSSPYNELTVGSSGTAVYALQARLVELGYASGTPSGSFGKATADVVKRFQAALGWEQTGVATIALQERLYAANAPAYSQQPATPVPTQKPVSTPVVMPDDTAPMAAYRTLQPGYSGADVAALQARLVDLGYAGGTPNGSYGDATAEAVVRFQMSIGLYLPESMGIASAALQEILFSPYAPLFVEGFTGEIVADTYEALEYGTSGEAVYKLKLRLAELGYLTEFLPGYEDIFDESTLFAITNIQYVMGVTETDGIATPELQAFLYSEYANSLKISY